MCTKSTHPVRLVYQGFYVWSPFTHVYVFKQKEREFMCAWVWARIPLSIKQRDQAV